MSIKIPGGGGGSGGSGDLSADGTGWPVTAAVTFSNNVTIANTKDLLAATAAGSDVGSAAAGFGVGYFDTSVETPLLGAATGNPTFADGADADPTKKLGFLLTGITTGTTRTVTWPDADVTIPTSIGDFLADGTVPMTGQIGIVDGTAADPSIVFNSDDDGTGTGFYRQAADAIGISTGGALRWKFVANNFTGSSGANISMTAGLLTGVGTSTQYGFMLGVFARTGTPYTLTAAEQGAIIANVGAAADSTWTLPTAAAGKWYTITQNDDTDNIIFKPAASDEIIWIDGTVVSAATGSITTTAQYQSFDVKALDGQTWIATDVQDRGTAFTVVA